MEIYTVKYWKSHYIQIGKYLSIFVLILKKKFILHYIHVIKQFYVLSISIFSACQSRQKLIFSYKNVFFREINVFAHFSMQEKIEGAKHMKWFRTSIQCIMQNDKKKSNIIQICMETSYFNKV